MLPSQSSSKHVAPCRSGSEELSSRLAVVYPREQLILDHAQTAKYTLPIILQNARLYWLRVTVAYQTSNRDINPECMPLMQLPNQGYPDKHTGCTSRSIEIASEAASANILLCISSSSDWMLSARRAFPYMQILLAQCRAPDAPATMTHRAWPPPPARPG